MAKSKFKVGDRVWFTYAGERFKQEGTVEHVRKDGLLIVHFDADPPRTILVVHPYEVDPISTKKACEARYESTSAKSRHATKKSPAQLQREINETLAQPRPASSAFEEAKAEEALLENEMSEAQAAINAFPRGPTGLTPDAVKATPEWRAAKTRVDKAFARLRAFNAVFVKRFAKELRAERSARTRERESRRGNLP